MPPDQKQHEEKLEVTKIYSIAGALSEKRPIINERPFRAPHHTIPAAALVGGGSNPKPGEISLAHYGVLFLDELPEFSRNVIEMLRQPMEDEQVTISRVKGVITFPSKMLLIAAMNPCPCGYLGDLTHQCTCSQGQIDRYFSRISGPFLDRIDIHLEIMALPYKDLFERDESGHQSEFCSNKQKKYRDSKSMRKEIEAARRMQQDRYKNEDILYNSQLLPHQIKKYCPLDNETKELLKEAFVRFSLSARSHHKIIKLGRTIADMEESDTIKLQHIAEAIQYRNLDKMYRGR